MAKPCIALLGSKTGGAGVGCGALGLRLLFGIRWPGAGDAGIVLFQLGNPAVPEGGPSSQLLPSRCKHANKSPVAPSFSVTVGGVSLHSKWFKLQHLQGYCSVHAHGMLVVCAIAGGISLCPGATAEEAGVSGRV